MIWRRVFVPETFTFRELDGVIQGAMGWEGIHRYDFHPRAARYGSWEVGASAPDVTLTVGCSRGTGVGAQLIDIQEA
jgi:hypothetical protein